MGWKPLHVLCNNRGVDKGTAMQVLKLLIEKYPEGVRHADNEDRLPIHYAAGTKSPEFCQVLIEAYPGSEHIIDGIDALPLHWACLEGSLATVEYLYRLVTNAIFQATTEGFYPIHYAIIGTCPLFNPTDAMEKVQFLLDCEPNQKRIQSEGRSLLCFACGTQVNEANIVARIQVIKVLFDAHPEAIEEIRNVCHHLVQLFIDGELIYAR